VVEQVVIPRSGVWYLLSKKDPRWNRTGQYSSPLGGPPFANPAEAQQALEELRAELGEEPPNDLRQIGLPYPSPKFKRLFDFHVFAASERQGLFQSLTRSGEGGLSDVNLNWRTGELTVARPGADPVHRLPVQFLGTLDTRRPLWRWGWCSEGLELSAASMNSARLLHDYGKEHEIPELTYDEIPLGQADDRPWFNVDYMAMASAHLCKAECYVAFPVREVSELWMYWLVIAPGLFAQPPIDSWRIFDVIRQAVPIWGRALQGSNCREVVRAYAGQMGCTVSEISELRLRIDTPSRGHLFVDFDESGEIGGIEHPPEPEPAQEPEPKPAPPNGNWLARLFGGKRP
jgi:hypothetical protein